MSRHFRAPTTRRPLTLRRSLRFEGLESRLALSTFTVTNADDSGAGSLRQAILDANANGGPDTIGFNIPGPGVHSIAVGSGTGGAALPAITDPITIDGYSQPGSSVNTDPVATNAVLTIELNGSLADSRGLDIRASNSVIRGLVINGFNATQGIWILSANDVEVSGNFIGTDPTGSFSIPNGDGILILDGSGSQIGGSTRAQRNLISGNRGTGVNTGGIVTPTSDNLVIGNLIGTDRTGILSVPNQHGINAGGGSRTRIGGTTPEERNVISGNRGIGVAMGDGDLWGNYIGTTADGDAALGNATGVVGGNVGGTLPGQGNVISGNRTGIGFNGNNIEGNLIGTDHTGSTAIPNEIGVFAQGDSTGRILGGTAPGARNIISGNDVGVRVDSPADPLLSGYYVSIVGNFIGTDLSGSLSLGNGTGIEFRGSGNLIGGTSPAERNVISGNRSSAIAVGGNHHRIVGNYVGVDVTGVNPLGNGLGVFIGGDGRSDNRIGGTSSGEGNLIAFNRSYGVLVGGRNIAVTQQWSVGNSILGNSIHSNHHDGLTDPKLGIELRAAFIAASDGLNPNDHLDADDGPNNLQNHPELSTATVSGATTTITGVLPSLPNARFRVEFFSNPTLGSSTYGEGENYLGALGDVPTDADGTATLIFVASTAIPVGHIITATATRLVDGVPTDTSEFSVGIPVTLGNLPPTAFITGPISAVPGQTRTFVVSATDAAADEATGFTYLVDFGDGSPAVSIPATANNGAGVSVDHIFNSPGDFTVSVTAADQHDATSDPAILEVSVTTVAVQPDECDCSSTVLAVSGTDGNDDIQISPVVGGLEVTLNSISLGTFDSPGRIAVFARGGDDDVQVAGSIMIPAWLYGGSGNDRLKGGASDDVLLGEAGDDLLVGGQGRDLLIGGLHADRIVGNADEDILIAGSTDFDAVAVALCAIMDEWTSSRSYAERTANLSSTHLRTDGPSTTVLDDNAKDTLTGSSGQDWFFANLVLESTDDADQKDKITDLSSAEFAADLDFIFGEP